jgi:dTDP-4-amino-4,6-dideoxygalactose transaminase
MIKVARPFVSEEEVEAVRKVLLSGNYVSGDRVAEFETTFANFVGTRHAVALNSGTAALHLCLAALGVGPGDEVIVPPLTFFSTVSCVLHQNAVPIFADIDPDTYCLDPQDVARRITDRTKAIIVVHLFGQAADLDQFAALSREHNIPIIEDCAQAHGTQYHGRVVGSIGAAGAFSFFATKHMTTGEGGLITTNSAEIAESARKMRSHGMTDRDTHVAIGYNYRMTEIAAAMGLVQLEKLETLNQKRIQFSMALIEGLSDLPWLKPPVLLPQVVHTFFWAAFQVDEAQLGCSTAQLVQRLRKAGVEVRHRYHAPLYRQPVLTQGEGFGRGCPWSCHHYGRTVDYAKQRLSQVEKVAGKLIGLPNHPGLTLQDIKDVIRIVKRIRQEV